MEREQYFADERRKYEEIITDLKTELSGFAVKERKMKDAMKQAFLRGINAISEQATCALDRADKMGMPPPLQKELEDKYPGDKDQVEVFSDGEVQEFKGYDIADVDVDQTIAMGGPGFQNEPQTVKVASPAVRVQQHSAEQARMQATMQQSFGETSSPQPIRPAMVKPEPKPQRVPATIVRGAQRPNEYNATGTLASRLRSATRIKQDPSSMLYKESIKGLKIKVEKE